jgi:hypothetical protein
MLLRNKSAKKLPNDAPPRHVNDGLGSSDDESIDKPVTESVKTSSNQNVKKNNRVLPSAKSKMKSHANAKKRQKNKTPAISDGIPVPPKKSIPPVAKMPSPTSSSSEEDDPSITRRDTEPLLPPATDEAVTLTALPPLQPTRDLSPVQWLKDPPPSVPNPVSRTSRRSTGNSPPPFANDPLRGPTLPLPSQHDIEQLNGKHFLSTSLLDYLLQCSLPSNIPDNILIGSSNSLSWFEAMNVKSDKSSAGYDAEGAQILRRKYQFYSLRAYDFITANCGSGHFSVAWVSFSIQNDNVFGEVRVYDSLRRSLRNNDPPKKDEVLGRLLLELQKFLELYCFCGTPIQKVLSSKPDLVLQKAQHVKCPQQTNGFDCGLFALGTLLHILDGCVEIHDAFASEHVSKLRMGLHRNLTTNTEVTWEFISAFFPRLRRDVHSILKLLPVMEENTNETGARETAKETAKDVEDSTEIQFNNDVDTDDEAPATPITPHRLVYDVEVNGDSTFGERKDITFCDMYLEKEREYDNLAQLNGDIDYYERTSGFRLIIRNSNDSSRIYCCGSHIKCCFRAKFGRSRNTGKIIMKSDLSHPYHSGKDAPPTANGRAYKKRMKGRIEESVDHAQNTKHSKTGAKDVMLTAGNYHALEATYKQAYRAMEGVFMGKVEDDVSSFQVIIPYMERFKMLNEESTVKYEVDNDGHINRLFVCPSIMNNAIRYARPVMSLDATHLKSRWKGVMYVASVKTPCNELFPVAMAIMNDNENEDGWTWFLQLLLTSCEFLVMDHPKSTVTRKYYTFISDRQKGLIKALQEVFPENHKMFCSIHIARNAAKLAGKRISGLVYSLSKTTSRMAAGDIMEKIERVSHSAKQYVNAIDEDQWRGTAWVDDPSLPPRYGICTSNLSESANQMFEEARDKSWLHCMDSVLRTMSKRIASLREEHKGLEGVEQTVLSLMNKRWENVIGYEVYQLTANSDEFIISRKRLGASDSSMQYTIDVSMRTCECGEWQEYGYPCVDAMAYLRLHRQLPFYQVLTAYVDPLYTYENEANMLRGNIKPVCIATIARDGRTLPPKPLKKRQAGRPKKKRLRKRSRWAHTPERSNVICSRCHRRGHNVRTCLEREQRAAQVTNGDSEAAFNVLDLS